MKFLKYHLKRVLEQIKQMADKHKKDRNYETGDLVYVKLDLNI